MTVFPKCKVIFEEKKNTLNVIQLPIIKQISPIFINKINNYSAIN